MYEIFYGVWFVMDSFQFILRHVSKNKITGILKKPLSLCIYYSLGKYKGSIILEERTIKSFNKYLLYEIYIYFLNYDRFFQTG